MITLKKLGTDTTTASEYYASAKLADGERYSAHALPVEAETSAPEVSPAFSAATESLAKLNS
jgi:hypothetical protein